MTASMNALGFSNEKHQRHHKPVADCFPNAEMPLVEEEDLEHENRTDNDSDDHLSNNYMSDAYKK